MSRTPDTPNHDDALFAEADKLAAQDLARLIDAGELAIEDLPDETLDLLIAGSTDATASRSSSPEPPVIESIERGDPGGPVVARIGRRRLAPLAIAAAVLFAAGIGIGRWGATPAATTDTMIARDPSMPPGLLSLYEPGETSLSISTLAERLQRDLQELGIDTDLLLSGGTEAARKKLEDVLKDTGDFLEDTGFPRLLPGGG